MDWTNPATVLQAMYWSMFIFLFAMGYSHGNRLI